ncbi:MAG: D-alanyl-D-alanine carboxypeptidase [Firmicutes bacterium]|nr:D-alanyl-D-alanine carboxypeptidase [Bacillota bacterium]
MKKPALIICLIIALLSWGALAAALELNGKAALLADPFSGRIFYESNSEDQLPVASISKLMTLVLVLEALEREEINLTDLVTASPFAASKRGTRIWLEEGEELQLEELLYAIAVGSANDAAVALAEFVAGSEENFVQLMNERGTELGLTKTVFHNCSGLPVDGGEPNQMSARDIALLAAHALRVPNLMNYVSTYEYTMRADSTKIPVLWNPNKLLRRYYGADGLKTGFTSEAGYCLAATAKRDQLRLIAITLGCTDESERENDARLLLDYGFRKYHAVQLYPENAAVTSLNCGNGQPGTVDVVVPKDFYVTVERNKELDLTTVIRLNPELKAPLAAGDVVGSVTAFYEEEMVGASPLIVPTEVVKAKLGTMIWRLGRKLGQAIF